MVLLEVDSGVAVFLLGVPTGRTEARRHGRKRLLGCQEEHAPALLKVSDRARVEPRRHEEIAFPNPRRGILWPRPGIKLAEAGRSGDAELAGLVLQGFIG